MEEKLNLQSGLALSKRRKSKVKIHLGRSREEYPEENHKSRLLGAPASLYVVRISRKPLRMFTYGSWEAMLGCYPSG